MGTLLQSLTILATFSKKNTKKVPLQELQVPFPPSFPKFPGSVPGRENHNKANCRHCHNIVGCHRCHNTVSCHRCHNTVGCHRCHSTGIDQSQYAKLVSHIITSLICHYCQILPMLTARAYYIPTKHSGPLTSITGLIARLLQGENSRLLALEPSEALEYIM